MTQMESPKRKMQKKNDYQRHKLFRKIKRRRKAQAEADQQIAVKQFRRKLKLPIITRSEWEEAPTFDNWYQAGHYQSGKDINIKKSKRGTFTKAAKQHGMSVQSFANKVLRNPSKYSAAMRKKANFAHNASKWNK